MTTTDGNDDDDDGMGWSQAPKTTGQPLAASRMAWKIAGLVPKPTHVSSKFLQDPE